MKKLFKVSALSLTLCSLTACSLLAQPAYKITDDESYRWGQNSYKDYLCLMSKPSKFGKAWQNALKLGEPLDQIKKKRVFVTMDGGLERTVGKFKAALIKTDRPSNSYALSKTYIYNQGVAHTENSQLNQSECTQIVKFYDKKFDQQQEQIRLAEQRRKAEQAFYASPQGQAYLAQQQLLNQQLAAQAAAVEAAKFRQLNQSMQNLANTVIQGQQNLAQQYNNMATSMPRYQFQPPQQQRLSTTCYRIANGIVQCK